MVAAPRPTLPVPPDRYDRAYMDRLVQSVRQQLQFAVTTETAVGSVLLLSPGGKVYRVQVSDAGTLSTTEVGIGSGS